MDLNGEKQHGCQCGWREENGGVGGGQRMDSLTCQHKDVGFHSEVEKSWGFKDRQDTIYMHKKRIILTTIWRIDCGRTKVDTRRLVRKPLQLIT